MMLANVKAAGEDNVPICQDTGTAVVFLELGQEVRIVGGNLEECVNEGVRTGYRNDYLRHSVVSQPFSKRENTCDNTPAVITGDGPRRPLEDIRPGQGRRRGELFQVHGTASIRGTPGDR
jgi:tartrate dehydratase alpha subunit/fumarate hydratase class I-like protein